MSDANSPDLRFAERVAATHQPTNHPFTYMERSNIVHHTSVVAQSWKMYRLRTAFYRAAAPTGIRTTPRLAAVNLEANKSKNTHYRLRTTGGKFQLFGTGKLILAGGVNHATSCTNSTRMARLLAHELKRPIAPVSFRVPNAVITAQLGRTVDTAIKDNEMITNVTPKFPGIALMLEGTLAARCTPEMYMGKGMVIMPGITSAAQLSEVADEIGSTLAPYYLPTNASQP